MILNERLQTELRNTVDERPIDSMLARQHLGIVFRGARGGVMGWDGLCERRRRLLNAMEFSII